MRRRVLAPVLAAAVTLAAASPAYALHRDETATSGQVAATLSYDYKTGQYGGYQFTHVRLAIDRAGQRLVDQALGGDWPGAFAGTKSLVVRDLDADGEPEVLVNLYSGGANCCYFTDSWRFDEPSGRYLFKVLRPALSFPYRLRDLNGDGVPEFVSADYRFAYKYGSNADTPRPLRIFDWDNGLVDVTRSYPRRAARDAAVYYRAYLRLRKHKGTNLRGVLAAYLADSYNARHGRRAWRFVVAAYHRGELNRRSPSEFGPFGRRYLRSLRRFLVRLGYLGPRRR